MDILAHLSILSLSVLVVCGDPATTCKYTQECSDWCPYPDDTTGYDCCEDKANQPPAPVEVKTDKPSTGAPTTGCPSIGSPRNGPYVNNQGNCYYFSSKADGGISAPTRVSWQQAQRICQALAGSYSLAELGNPHNLKSDAWLMETIKEYSEQVWLGAMDDGSNNWYWSNLETRRALSFNNPYWAPSQPRNCGGGPQRNCLSTIKMGRFYPQRRQYFNDADCTTEMHYVCQQLFKKTSAPPCEDKNW